MKNAALTKLIEDYLQQGNGIEGIGHYVKKLAVRVALEASQGNVTAAALMLKTHRNNLVRWMHEWGLEETPEGIKQGARSDVGNAAWQALGRARGVRNLASEPPGAVV